MNDILGDALKKISSADFCESISSPVPVSAPVDPLAADSLAVPELPGVSAVATFADTNMEPASESATQQQPECDEVSCTDCEPVSPSRELAMPAAGANPSDRGDGSISLANRDVSPVVSNRNPLHFVMDHRRQTAAVIVLLCMAGLWFDDSSGDSTNKTSATDASDAFAYAEAEMLLDDFDAVEVHPLREPADPVEVVNVNQFPLTFPAVDEAAVGTAAFGYPESAANYEDSSQINGVPDSSYKEGDFPLHSPFGTASATGARAGKFKGRIEPMN